jgi:hypothetical protein
LASFGAALILARFSRLWRFLALLSLWAVRMGKASVTIKEWLVPTLGSRPHDPLAAADGSRAGRAISRLPAYI